MGFLDFLVILKELLLLIIFVLHASLLSSPSLISLLTFRLLRTLWILAHRLHIGLSYWSLQVVILNASLGFVLALLFDVAFNINYTTGIIQKMHLILRNIRWILVSSWLIYHLTIISFHLIWCIIVTPCEQTLWKRYSWDLRQGCEWLMWCKEALVFDFSVLVNGSSFHIFLWYISIIILLIKLLALTILQIHLATWIIWLITRPNIAQVWVILILLESKKWRWPIFFLLDGKFFFDIIVENVDVANGVSVFPFILLGIIVIVLGIRV